MLSRHSGFGDLERLADDEEDDQTSGVTDLPESVPHRVIFINRIQLYRFCSNRISTAKYNAFSFIPKFLFEQFRRYSNIFFLFIALLQQIPNVSPTGRYTTALPLLFIFTVSAIKEIVEDFKRHRADDTVNNSLVQALRDGAWCQVKWTEVAVGDVVRVCNDNFFPADLVLLSSSEPHGICYIETANLDGETNLKIRQGISQTSRALTVEDLATLRGSIECELPNKNLYEFTGNIRLEGKQTPYPLGPDQILLRGAKLKNTDWIFGVVIYSGPESKLMMNSTAAPLKRSTVDRLTNTQILLMFALLVLICLISSIASEVWITKHVSTDWYLGLDELTGSNFGYTFLTFIILYNNLIPISLQVTLEVVRYIQATFINQDLDMYHEETDSPAIARTSNLNEELGQVKFVLSDKTGTLTQNIMEFKMCSIAGVKYGEYGRNVESFNVLLQHLSQKQPHEGYIREFLTLLAVCHTVVPDKRSESTDIKYQAASPDERALVYGAKSLGFVFTTRTPEFVIIDCLGQEERYEVLNVLEFTSERKRMSVIVRTPSGKIKLLCKGADTVICDRLGDNQQFREVTLKHLEDFATEGLRTLCCAVADISEEFYEDWKHTYYKASTSLQYRERKLEDAAQLVENNLMLLGATAIEDRLQEGVPECISDLIKADIRVWLLTGDKQETAINIGYSCRLLHRGMTPFVINEESLDSTREALTKYIRYLNQENELGCALIIDGKSLKYALSCDLKQDFADVALACQTVICCRVSPIQKSEVVELIKSFTQCVTLAIGDGANDVAMIQAAHVGIGISGLEGLQAVCASDYAIAQFRYLSKLLFVHGSLSYQRMTKLILYSFHKNICLYLIELWFAMVSAWSGQVLFERWTIGLYNVIFTAAPPFAIGLFDRKCSIDTMMKYPELYRTSQNAQLFNVRVFWLWIFSAIYHSLLLFWLTAGVTYGGVLWPNGRTGGYLIVGNMVYTYTVVTVCLKAGLAINTWTWVTHIAIWGSIASWFVFIFIYSEVWPALPIAAEMCGMASIVFESPVFWFGLFCIPVLTLLLDLTFIVLRQSVWRTLEEKVRQSELSKQDPASVIATGRQSKPRMSETAQLLRNVRTAFKRQRPRTTADVEMSHGYAFSQEEHGVLSQSEVIRAYDSTKAKPSGL